jgi:hypothetical protein
VLSFCLHIVLSVLTIQADLPTHRNDRAVL